MPSPLFESDMWKKFWVLSLVAVLFPGQVWTEVAEDKKYLAQGKASCATHFFEPDVMTFSDFLGPFSRYGTLF